MSENRNYRQLRTSKAQNVPATIRRIMKSLSRYPVHMFFIMLGLILASLTNVVSSYFFRPIIDNYVVPYIGQANPDLSGFARMLGVMAAVYLTGVIADYLWRKLMSVVSTGVLNDVRKELFSHMQDMSVRFYDSHTHGELMNFYTNDVDTMRPMLAETFPTFFQTVINVVGVFYMMFRLSFNLTLVAIASICLMLLVTFILARSGRRYFVQIQRAVSNINGYVEEIFQGQKVVKVFNHEKEVTDDFRKYNNDAYHASVMTNLFGGMLFPINMNLAYLTYAVVAVLGAGLCISGQITLGVLSSFLLYTRQISGPISNLSQQFNGVMMAIAGAERVYSIIDSPTETDEGRTVLVNATYDENNQLIECAERTGLWAWKRPREDGYELIRLRGDVRFHNVTFGYEEDHTVLKNISLYAKPGQKIAFVGSTGAGKTTITNLINRFYDVGEGQITYDGIDVRDIAKSSLRTSLGCVLQDTNLFSGTVMENIRYGNLKATDEQCMAAARLANADSFIQRLPDGYNTMLTANGANLSQGQRQLLNIARAAVADPPVLILDEATSSIDTHTERLIEKGMDELMAGRTVFVIAHRLSTIRNSSAIIVLEHGEIIERGDHEALLADKGRYYQLYTGIAELD